MSLVSQFLTNYITSNCRPSLISIDCLYGSGKALECGCPKELVKQQETYDMYGFFSWRKCCDCRWSRYWHLILPSAWPFRHHFIDNIDDRHHQESIRDKPFYSSLSAVYVILDASTCCPKMKWWVLERGHWRNVKYNRVSSRKLLGDFYSEHAA